MLDEKALKRIASKIKQDKLFSVVKSEAEAKETVANLQVNGYQANYQKVGNVYKIFYSNKIPQYKDTPLANKESSAYANFSKAGLTKLLDNKQEKYAFDEGSIWHVQEIDGVPYIVKEVAEDDEDKFIRRKATASAKNIQYKGELNVGIVQLLAKKNIIISEQLIDNIKDKVLSKALQMPSVQQLIVEYAKGNNNGN